MTIKRKDARQLLTESVKELAAKKTINKICVAEIARNCSMSNSNFYHYFSDKYELISYVIGEEIDHRISDKVMTLNELFIEFLDMMEDNRQFYSNVLVTTLSEYPNHAFFHETLDTKVKNLIVSNCMSIIPGKKLDLTLNVYLAGITAIMCNHIIYQRGTRTELMDAFMVAVPASLRPYISMGCQYLS
jgi:AcrR family transcriptional regulator